MHFRKSLLALLACASIVAGCHRQGFDPRAFQSTDALFSAALREYEARRWSNAARAFEVLTVDLPARDPRLASAYFYLGSTQQRMGEHLTAAQTFYRVYESFPDDTLAPRALLQAGRAYSTLWRKPDLDATHGRSAHGVYQTLVVMYPSAPETPEAQREIARLEQMFATKDYNTGYHYLRLRAYDSAIIYFTDVIENWPNAPRTRDAHLRLLEAYTAIRYTEDARELCASMRARYPNDREVTQACSRLA
jgi:outer membrane assembly lipoprotein YfiO